MQDFNKPFSEIQDQWSTKKGLLLVLCVTAVLLLWVFSSAELQRISAYQWSTFAIVLAIIAAVWFLTRLPRIPKKKVGFGVAIVYEENNESKRIQADFVSRLRELVSASDRLRYTFHFVEFSPRLARRFVDGEQEWLSAKTRCHFVLYGQAKSRNVAGGPSYVLELRGIVRHGQFLDEVQKRFGDDFTNVLPSRMIVKDANSLLAFEFAARHLDVVARYVIGVAAALTGDAGYGEQLLLDAKQRLDALPVVGDGSAFAVLRSRILNRLGELYDALLSTSNLRSLRSRNVEDLRDSKTLLEKRRSIAPDNYLAQQSAAMCAFLIDGDIAKARAEYSACHRVNDASWRYGEAFLSAYEGDLDRCYKEYRSAFGAPLADVSIPNQCEEFIQIALEQEPARYWLHLSLGMINYRAKGDLVAARRDFEQFLKRAEPERFVPQVVAVKQWLMEIETSLVGVPLR